MGGQIGIKDDYENVTLKQVKLTDTSGCCKSPYRKKAAGKKHQKGLIDLYCYGRELPCMKDNHLLFGPF